MARKLPTEEEKQKPLLTEEQEREREIQEINEIAKRNVAEETEAWQKTREPDPTLIEETEAKERQERFAQALEFLSDEKWKEIQETVIEPMQSKIDEAHEKLSQWRDQGNNFVTYVYKEYTKALLDACKKELVKWEKETFNVKVEELEKENQAISKILHEMDEIFEDMVIEFAEKLGKQKKPKKRKKRKR